MPCFLATVHQQALKPIFLNQSGYEAIGCLNAEDAYDKLVDHVIDLIVSDIMMPEIDGFEFAESVREINEDIPILFLGILPYALLFLRMCDIHGKTRIV